MKKVTELTSEGYILELATGSVIGWKCTGCSTAHLFEGNQKTDIELAAMALNAWMQTHANC